MAQNSHTANAVVLRCEGEEQTDILIEKFLASLQVSRDIADPENGEYYEAIQRKIVNQNPGPVIRWAKKDGNFLPETLIHSLPKEYRDTPGIRFDELEE